MFFGTSGAGLFADIDIQVGQVLFIKNQFLENTTIFNFYVMFWTMVFEVLNMEHVKLWHENVFFLVT